MSGISAYKSDVGRTAKYNEDYIWIDEAAGIYIVADGMGGQEAGELASELTATTAGQFIAVRLKAEAGPLSATAAKEWVIGALEAANETVMQAAKEAQQARPMGAAMVLALVRPPTAYICHAGDARAYLGRNSVLTRLTTDDSWVAQLVANGLISEEQAQFHPLGHILTKAVGHEAPLEPVLTEVTISPGDWLLLCSDGLWKMIVEEQFLAALGEPQATPATVVETLVEAANATGGKDNISIIAIKIP